MCSGSSEEGESAPLDPLAQEFHEARNRPLEAHAPAGLDEVLAAHAAILRVMADQVGQLTALLHEIATG